MTTETWDKMAAAVALGALIGIIAFLLYGCAGGVRHPVVPPPRGYKPPAQFWDCDVMEQVTFPGERPMIRLECPTEIVLVDLKTGKVQERLSIEDFLRFWRDK